MSECPRCRKSDAPERVVCVDREGVMHHSHTESDPQIKQCYADGWACMVACTECAGDVLPLAVFA